ncbi:hypothetical protein [Streptomyces sp. NPDC001978]|uniref:hypothetical protein n=1 Tax=Streptomyces sp. NPDC001978 TaxID=3364627 RepID=UPI003676557E
MMEELIFAIASAGTLLLSGATAFIALSSTRKRRRLDARSRAGLVFARLEKSPSGRAVWVLENRSEHAIYDVRLEVPDSEVSFKSLFPGEQRVAADEALLQSQESIDPVLTFKDDGGFHWQVGRSGVKETNGEKEKRDVFNSLTVSTLVALITTLATVLGAVITIVISLQGR